MPLIDMEIRRAFESGAWKAKRDGKPIEAAELRIGQNSVNVSLQSEILEVAPFENFVDFHDAESLSFCQMSCAGGLVLQPGFLYLAAVRESFDCSAPLWIERYEEVRIDAVIWAPEKRRVETYFYQTIDGRSTAARSGLSVHLTAGQADYGFSAPFTLELTTVWPLKIYTGDHVAQIYFNALSGGEPGTRYDSVYAHQSGPASAILGKERFQ